MNNNKLFTYYRPNLGTIKWKLIKEILRLNKIATEMFNIEELTEEELYKMKINDLKNVETELRVQIGIKRKFNHSKYII